MENTINETGERQTNGGQTAGNDAPRSGLPGLVQALEREDGYISLVRVMAAAAFATIYGLYIVNFFKHDCTFAYFDTITTLTGAIIFATIGSKYVDFKQQVNLGK